MEVSVLAHRYFTNDIQGDTASLSGADAQHLTRVLRAVPGQQITLCDGAGFDYDAEILALPPGRVELAIHARRASAAEPKLWARACIAWAKGDRMDYAVQKAVELGAAEILPFFSEHCVARPKNTEEKAERLGRIAREAAKQAGRGILPAVKSPLPFKQMLGVAADGLAILFYERGGRPLRELLPGNARRASLITGPEGGFSPAEVEAAVAAGCAVAGLGPRILRCETAPAAALAALFTLSGDLE